LNNPFEAVKGWYMSTNLDVYKKIYKTLDASLTVELRKQIAWGKDTGITGTPTFFVNGRVLPELFSWVDFTNILDYELKNTN
jgi:protein-disulfide isomerase